MRTPSRVDHFVWRRFISRSTSLSRTQESDGLASDLRTGFLFCQMVCIGLRCFLCGQRASVNACHRLSLSCVVLVLHPNFESGYPFGAGCPHGDHLTGGEVTVRLRPLFGAGLLPDAPIAPVPQDKSSYPAAQNQRHQDRNDRGLVAVSSKGQERRRHDHQFTKKSRSFNSRRRSVGCYDFPRCFCIEPPFISMRWAL